MACVFRKIPVRKAIEVKLIRNMIFIPISEEKSLLVNTLNGLIDEIDTDTLNILKTWEAAESITPLTESEIGLFADLNKRGYLVANGDAEEKIKNEIYAKLRLDMEKKKEKRESITFILTYGCNFRCPYCFEADNPSIHGVITKEMVDAALSMTDDNLKNIGLFGGEPLLPGNRDILEYIFKVKRDVKYNITTNGYYLLEFFDLLKSIDISFIQVTLDGAESTHNSRRYLANGSPTYDKIMRGIIKCLENEIKIRIRFNLDNENYDECIELRRVLNETLPNANEYLTFEMQPIFQLDIKNRSRIIENMYTTDADKSEDELAKNNRILTSFNPIIQFFMSKKKMKPLYNFCNAHVSSILYDPTGEMFPCLVSVGKKPLSVGTYYPEIKFKENNIFNRNIETIKECGKCKYAFLCGGGCPVGIADESELYKPKCYATLFDIHTLVPLMYNKNFNGGNCNARVNNS